MHLLNTDLLALLTACRATFVCDDTHGRSVYHTGDGRVVFASQAERGEYHYVQIVSGDKAEYVAASSSCIPMNHGWA